MRRMFGRLFPRSMSHRASLRHMGPKLPEEPVEAGGRCIRIRSGKPKLIAVDGDPRVLNLIARAAEPWYHVIAARDSSWPRAWLLQYPDVAAIVATDQLSCADGAELLERCQMIRRDVLRVLITPRVDAADQVRALMTGVAQRLVEWPMCVESLRVAIDPASLGYEVSSEALVA